VVVVALQLLKFGVYRDCNCELNVVAESLDCGFVIENRGYGSLEMMKLYLVNKVFKREREVKGVLHHGLCFCVDYTNQTTCAAQ